MANEYFVRVRGSISGPFDAQKLKEMAAAGTITVEAQISKDGKTGWVPAAKVRGLFPSIIPSPRSATAASIESYVSNGRLYWRA